MKIELKNKELSPAIEFLQTLNLKPADSRHRSKFVNLIVSAFNELSKEEQALLKEFDLVNEDGVLKEQSDKNKENRLKFNAEQQKLLDEVVVIEGGTYTKNINEIPRILNEIEMELSGKNAEIYDRLLDEFEKTEDLTKDAE